MSGYPDHIYISVDFEEPFTMPNGEVLEGIEIVPYRKLKNKDVVAMRTKFDADAMQHLIECASIGSKKKDGSPLPYEFWNELERGTALDIISAMQPEVQEGFVDPKS